MTKWFGKAAPTLIAAPVAAPSGERRYQDQPRSDRRGFLRRLGAQPLISMLPVQEDAELPAFDALPCNDQETLAQQPVAYRLALGQRLPRLPWAEGRRLPWHTRTVEERCNACLICAERCPTGALAGSDNGFERTLSFDPLLCSNCSVCVKVCPPQSIVPHILPAPEQLAAGRRMLMYRRLQACADCGRFFLPESPESTATSPGQASCPSCRNEQEMDDEWLAMLEA